jgi:hypothetical protein
MELVNLLAATDSQALNLILWIIAVALGLYGISLAVRGQIMLGVLLVIAAFIVGPGGVSLFG